MIRTLIFLFTFIIGLPICYSQSFEAKLRSALEKDPKFIAYLDSRNAFINSNGVRVFGGKVGLQYDNKLTFGIGYNTLATDYESEYFVNQVAQEVALKYWYTSPFVEYVFYRDERWEFAIPVQLGFGSSYYIQKSDQKKLAQRFVMSYEPAISFQYRFLNYFGAGLGVGYRLMVIPNNRINEQFTSPVYMLKFKIYFEELFDKKGS